MPHQDPCNAPLHTPERTSHVILSTAATQHPNDSPLPSRPVWAHGETTTPIASAADTDTAEVHDELTSESSLNVSDWSRGAESSYASSRNSSSSSSSSSSSFSYREDDETTQDRVAPQDDQASDAESGGGETDEAVHGAWDDTTHWLTAAALDVHSLAGHRITVARAVGHVILVGTNRGMVALLHPRSGAIQHSFVHQPHPAPQSPLPLPQYAIVDVDSNAKGTVIASCDASSQTWIVQRVTHAPHTSATTYSMKFTTGAAHTNTRAAPSASSLPCSFSCGVCCQGAVSDSEVLCGIALHPRYGATNDLAHPLVYATQSRVVLVTATRMVLRTRREEVIHQRSRAHKHSNSVGGSGGFGIPSHLLFGTAMRSNTSASTDRNNNNSSSGDGTAGAGEGVEDDGGAVLAVRWCVHREDWLAWATEQWVCVYSYTARCLLSRVQCWPTTVTTAARMPSCHPVHHMSRGTGVGSDAHPRNVHWSETPCRGSLVWADEHTVMCGWGYRVAELCVSDDEHEEAQTRDREEEERCTYLGKADDSASRSAVNAVSARDDESPCNTGSSESAMMRAVRVVSQRQTLLNQRLRTSFFASSLPLRGQNDRGSSANNFDANSLDSHSSGNYSHERYQGRPRIHRANQAEAVDEDGQEVVVKKMAARGTASATRGRARVTVVTNHHTRHVCPDSQDTHGDNRSENVTAMNLARAEATHEDSERGGSTEGEKDFIVCGMAPWGLRRYLLLGVCADPTGSAVELRVVRRHDLGVLHRGRLPLRCVHPLQLQLSMYTLTDESNPNKGHIDMRANDDDGIDANDDAVSYEEDRAVHNAKAGRRDSSSNHGNDTSSHRPSEKDTDPLFGEVGCLQRARFVVMAGNCVLRIRACRVQEHVRYLVRMGAVDRAYAYAHQHLRSLPRHSFTSLGEYMWRYLLRHGCTCRSNNGNPENGPGDDGVHGICTAVSRSDGSRACAHVSCASAWTALLPWLPQLVGLHVHRWEACILRLYSCGEAWRLLYLLPVPPQATVIASTAAASSFQASQHRVSAADLHESCRHRSQATGGSNGALPPVYYDLVLLQCLSHRPELLADGLVRLKGLFSLPVIVQATGEALERRFGEIYCTAHTHKHTRNDANSNTDANTKKGDDSSSSSSSSATSDDLKDVVCFRLRETGTAVAAPVRSKTMRDEVYIAVGVAYATLLCWHRRFRAALHILLQLGAIGTLVQQVRTERLYREAWELLPALLRSDSDGAVLRLLLEHATHATAAGESWDEWECGDGCSGGCEGRHSGAMNNNNNNHHHDEDHDCEDSAVDWRDYLLHDDACTWVDLEHAHNDGQTHDGAGSGSDREYTATPDSLRPESVLRRLACTDRPQLLLYLKALWLVAPDAFRRVAQAHTRLLVTLYLDYDRDGLMPFLRYCAPWLSRAEGEIFALCQWHCVREAVLLLLLHMNQGERGLRTVVYETHNMRRALRLIVDVRSRRERVGLFRKLVDMAIDDHMSLPMARFALGEVVKRGGGGDNSGMGATKHRNGSGAGDASAAGPAERDRVCPPPYSARVSFAHGGPRRGDAGTGRRPLSRGSTTPMSSAVGSRDKPASLPSLPQHTNGWVWRRYTQHRTHAGDGFAEIAALYDVQESTLRRANPVWSAPTAGEVGEAAASARAGEELPTGVWVTVPLNVLSSLLEAVAEAQTRGLHGRGWKHFLECNRCNNNNNMKSVGSSTYGMNGGEGAKRGSSDDFIDVDYLLHALPAQEAIPNALSRVAVLIRHDAERVARYTVAAHVTEQSVMVRYGELLRRRGAAVRVGRCDNSCRPSHIAQKTQGGRCCAECALTVVEDMIAFDCGHVVHARCATDSQVRTTAARRHAERAGVRCPVCTPCLLCPD